MIPTLQSDVESVSTKRTHIVTTTPVAHSSFSAQAPRFDLTIKSDFPALMADKLRSQLGQVSGYESGTHYVASHTSTETRVSVLGFSASSSYLDVFLVVSQANLWVELSR